MFFKFILYFIFMSFSASVTADDQCDSHLRKFPEDCALQIHYRKLRKAFKERDLNIDFIALYRVLRLVDSKIIDKCKDIEGKESYDNIISKPWQLYDPAPKSWILWEAGNYFREVLNYALDYRRDWQIWWKLTLNDLETLHKVYVDPQVQFENGGGKVGNLLSNFFGLVSAPIHEAPGIMRHAIYNKELLRCDSGTITLQQEEISAINSFERETRDGKPYIEWSKACENKGKIFFLSAEYVNCEMLSLINEINVRIYHYLANEPSVTESPLSFVARIQRAYVAIHPFRQGNGRMSRYLQDLILAKLDMPLIPGGYLQEDLSVSLNKYQNSTLSAVKNMLYSLESCLDDSRKDMLECQSLYKNYEPKKDCFNPLQEIRNSVSESFLTKFSNKKLMTWSDIIELNSWGNSSENYYRSPFPSLRMTPFQGFFGHDFFPLPEKK